MTCIDVRPGRKKWPQRSHLTYFYKVLHTCHTTPSKTGGSKEKTEDTRILSLPNLNHWQLQTLKPDLNARIPHNLMPCSLPAPPSPAIGTNDNTKLWKHVTADVATGTAAVREGVSRSAICAQPQVGTEPRPPPLSEVCFCCPRRSRRRLPSRCQSTRRPTAAGRRRVPRAAQP